MIRVICDKCDARHEYPDSHAGRIAKCMDCKASIILPAAGTEEWYDSDEPRLIEDVEPSAKVIANSLLIIVPLVALCAVVLFGVIALTQAKKEPPQKTAIQIQNEKEMSEQSRKALEENIEAGVSIIAALLVIVIAIAWISAVYYAGAWIARDANRRGMNGLGWTIFYFAFQIINRLVLAGVFTALLSATAKATNKGGIVSAVVFAPLWALLLASELIHWGGLFVYLFSRRKGGFDKCPNCHDAFLETLKNCPHCEHRP